MAKAEQFKEVDDFAKRLVAEGHTDTVEIKEQQDILRYVINRKLVFKRTEVMRIKKLWTLLFECYFKLCS